MNENHTLLRLPASCPLLLRHEELIASLRKADRRARWGRLLRHPLHTLTNRIGWTKVSPLQPDFIAHRGWPIQVHRALRKLPPQFITGYSLEVESARWLYNLIRDNPLNCIVECGCGISTVILALAIADRPVRFYSLEHDATWLNITQTALDVLGLAGRVTLLHAPLKAISFAGCVYQAPTPPVLEGCKADLLFIDAPAGHVGRGGTLPMMLSALAPHALAVLDDANRLEEAKCVSNWVHQGLAAFKGFVPLGFGLALMER
jgi:predicted O-methyltransferase YrrM